MNLLWYDLETFGRYSRYDRIAQFAALRTNDRFEALEEPIVLYGKLSPDYIPDPLACLITGITPQEANQKGMVEADLIREIDKQLSRPGTCTLGFNTIAFDDEFIRNLYYRNFYDPYVREWADGNSRWDIINLVRATRDLRPEGIEWPEGESGKPTVRLQALTEANSLAHEHAHDALSDVYATIAVAKLIREKQPKLFEWAYRHRSKDQGRTLIDLADKTPLVHTSPAFYSEKGYTTLICPIVSNPKRRNVIHAFDLRQDPSVLLELPEDELRRRLFTPEAELTAEGTEPVALYEIAMNKSPFLAPMTVMTRETSERLGVDLALARERWTRLKNDGSLASRLRRVLNRAPAWGSIDDPDLQIYDRFFPDEDKKVFEKIRQTPASELISLTVKAKDSRIPEMLRRYIGRNTPELLDEEGLRRWRSFCASRILFPPIPGASDLGEFRKRLKSWRESEELEAEKKPIIKALELYGDELETLVLRDSAQLS